MDVTVSVSFLLTAILYSSSNQWVLGEDCLLPNCFPQGASIPGDLLPTETPQMVILSFHSSIGTLYYEEYTDLLRDRQNPNGCQLRATFFVSHDFTDYPSVNALVKAGHEIGVNTISAESYAGYWDTTRWTDETQGMREILNKFGLIRNEDIMGSQGPYLQDGGGPMLMALNQSGFKYDSTEAIQYSPEKSPYWPYTTHSEGYPTSLWEVPLTTLYWNGANCATLRSCHNVTTKEEALQILQNNFLLHYNSNKAPFNLIIDPSWWGFSMYEEALEAFLDYIHSFEDVYVVTANQAIQWIQNPTTLSNLSTLEPWHCDQKPAVGECSQIYSCHYSSTATPDGGERYVNFCAPCPPNYPWVGNPDGN